MIKKLEKVLEACWSSDTSSDAENWDTANKAYGQCAVTALVVQDYCGGNIVNSIVKVPEWGDAGEAVSHYFNKIGDKEIDLTRKQFPEGTEVPEGMDKKKDFETTRQYVLSYAPTVERYELLKQRIEEELEKL